jgi:hypothetical protein
LWLAAWLLLLWLMVSPWRRLGGLVSEQLRWLASWIFPVAFIVGCASGRLGRHAARPGSGRCHAGLLRWLLLPQAVLTAVVLLLLRQLGFDDVLTVVYTAFASYWAGLDIAFGAYPLMEGRHYSFRGPIRSRTRLPEPRDLSPWLGG